MSSTCRGLCKTMYGKGCFLKAYDNSSCYHRAVQRTLLLEHILLLLLLTRGGRFGVIISHIEGDDIGDGITQGEVTAEAGWHFGGAKLLRETNEQVCLRHYTENILVIFSQT